MDCGWWLHDVHLPLSQEHHLSEEVHCKACFLWLGCDPHGEPQPVSWLEPADSPPVFFGGDHVSNFEILSHLTVPLESCMAYGDCLNGCCAADAQSLATAWC